MSNNQLKQAVLELKPDPSDASPRTPSARALRGGRFCLSAFMSSPALRYAFDCDRIFPIRHAPYHAPGVRGAQFG